MVSLEDSHSSSNHFPLPRNNYTSSSTKINRHVGRLMRTIRSNIFHSDKDSGNNTNDFPFFGPVALVRFAFVSGNLIDSIVDMRLGELALRTNKSVKSSSSLEDFLDLSRFCSH